MELEPDLDHPALRSSRSHHSLSALLAIIILGVVVGNAVTLVMYEAYQRWQIQRALVAFTAMTDRIAAEAKATAAENARHAAAAARAAAQQAQVKQQLNSTCQYWQQQVRTENTPQNRNYRDMACARANGAFQ